VNAIESSESVRHRSTWSGRLCLAAAVALLWAGLHFVVDATVLSRGLTRPVCVLVGDGGIVAAVTVLILLAVGALIGTLLCSRREGAQGLLVVGLALALWASPGGTMDDWLKMRNTTAGPPTGAAYVPLLAEYAYWAIVTAAVFVLTGRQRRSAEDAGVSPNERRKSPLASATELRDGITALIVTAVVAAVLMFILTGPRVGHTYRGQVYFAVAVACIVGTLAARRVSGVRRFTWYLPTPWLIGIIGVWLAAIRPGLGAGYENINVIPAWGLVRPLPIEMVGVGLVAIVLTLRAANRLSSEAAQA
jgi:hypothetical protein